MKKNLVATGKAVAYFLLMGFALPLLLDRKITALWVLGSAGISLVITVLPAYIIARLSGKKASKSQALLSARWIKIVLNVLQRKWTRVIVIAVSFFVLMTFILPAMEGRPLDTAWMIISAIAAIIGAVVGDYLNEKQTARKARKTRRHK